jgi:hypothetical protein
MLHETKLGPVVLSTAGPATYSKIYALQLRCRPALAVSVAWFVGGGP